MGQQFVYRHLPMEEKEKMVIQYRDLCLKQAHVFQASCPNLYDFEDWFQLAQEGVLKASNGYKEGKGAKFITYATRVIINKLAAEVTSKNNQQYLKIMKSSQVKKYTSDEENYGPYHKTSDDEKLSGAAYNSDESQCENFEDDDIMDMTIRQAIHYAETTKLFDEKERYIFRYRIKPELLGTDDKKTQQMIADEIGCSQEYVFSLEHKIMQRLQVYIGSIGFTVTNGGLETR